MTNKYFLKWVISSLLFILECLIGLEYFVCQSERTCLRVYRQPIQVTQFIKDGIDTTNRFIIISSDSLINAKLDTLTSFYDFFKRFNSLSISYQIPISKKWRFIQCLHTHVLKKTYPHFAILVYRPIVGYFVGTSR